MDQQLPKHDCRNFVKKVFLVLDGELPEPEQRMFIADIQRCKSCLDHFDIEKSFKEFVTAKVERKACSEQLKQDILDRVREEEND
ncbi:MAG: hypothetical protein R2794_05520 [Chitinophagales bacterium]